MLTSNAVTFETASTVLAGFAWSVAVSRNERWPLRRYGASSAWSAGRLPAASAWTVRCSSPSSEMFTSPPGVKPLPPIGTGSRRISPLTSSVEVT